MFIGSFRELKIFILDKLAPEGDEYSLELVSCEGIHELHTRPDGDFIPFLHERSIGYCQYELGIISYTGKLALPAPQTPIHHSEVQFFFTQQGTLLEAGFHHTPPETVQFELYRQIGDNLPTTIDSSSRVGHVIVCSQRHL